MVAFFSSDVLIAFFILSLSSWMKEIHLHSCFWQSSVIVRWWSCCWRVINKVFGVLSQFSSVMMQMKESRDIHLCPPGDQDQITLLCYFTYTNVSCQLQKFSSEYSYFTTVKASDFPPKLLIFILNLKLHKTFSLFWYMFYLNVSVFFIHYVMCLYIFYCLLKYILSFKCKVYLFQF